jgi:hypothetical protein
LISSAFIGDQQFWAHVQQTHDGILASTRVLKTEARGFTPVTVKSTPSILFQE